MNNIQIWEKFDKTTNWFKKSELLKMLLPIANYSDFDKICEVYLTAQSPEFKGKVIDILENLASNYGVLSEDKIPNYNALLKKYKIKTLVNFEYRDYYPTTLDNLFETYNKLREKHLAKFLSKGSRIDLKFSLNDFCNGYLTVQIWYSSQTRYENLSYGFYTNLRDYQGELINKSPFDHVHLQVSSLQKTERIFEDNFEILEVNQAQIKMYFKYAQTHFEHLKSIAPAQFDMVKNLPFEQFTKRNSSDLWHFLSLINVNKQIGNTDFIAKLKAIGLEKMKQNMAGYSWREYFKN